MSILDHHEMQIEFRGPTARVKDLRLVTVAEGRTMPSGVKDPLWFGLPDRLLSLRMSADLGMISLGNLSGVSNPTIANTENRKTIPRVNTVEALAYALGVSPTWLGFGHDGDEPFRERIRRSFLHLPKDPRPGQPQPCPYAHKMLPQRLRDTLERAGLSLRALALAAGLSGPGVAKIENGESVPTLDNVEALARALGVSPGWLAFGVGRGLDGKKHKPPVLTGMM